MTTDEKTIDKKVNMQKYLNYCHVKLENIHILLVKNVYCPNVKNNNRTS